MPRVYTSTKNNRGATRSCGHLGCGAVIKVGERYFWWKFRYGGRHFRCCKHHPRASDLTQSKMSGVYAATESVEDFINSKSFDIKELPQALSIAADEIESVRDEYQESLDNMPDGTQEGPVGENIQERIDALDEFAENLRNAEQEIEGDFEELDELKGKERTLKIEELVETANSALSDFNW